MRREDRVSASLKVWRADPDEGEDIAVEFRLTYEGALLAASNSNKKRPRHKHEIRQVFHRQLRRLWDGHPFLKQAVVTDPQYGRGALPHKLLREELADQYARCGYNFVPLVTPDLAVSCRVDILCLRPGPVGEIIQKTGDLDNRLKTLFDALRVPENVAELGGYTEPRDDERPFFCLLSDDSLINHVSVETDLLLAPTSEDATDNDVRLIIRVELRPLIVGWNNINFG